MGLRERLQELLGLHDNDGDYPSSGYGDVDPDQYVDARDTPLEYGEDAVYAPEGGRDNVIAMPGVSSFQSELLIMEPHSFQEVPAAVIALRDRKVVVLNLGNLEADEAQRSVDYVAGGTFALDGHQERIGKCVFLFTPHSVQITSQTAAAVAGAMAQGYPPTPPPSFTHPTSSLLTQEQDMLRKLELRAGQQRPPGHF